MVTPILDFWVKCASGARLGGEGIGNHFDHNKLVMFTWLLMKIIDENKKNKSMYHNTVIFLVKIKKRKCQVKVRCSTFKCDVVIFDSLFLLLGFLFKYKISTNCSAHGVQHTLARGADSLKYLVKNSMFCDKNFRIFYLTRSFTT